MRKLINWLVNVKWKQTIGYAALFLFLFVMFLYLTFPYDAIKDTIVKRIESQGNISVTIDKISPFRLAGFRIKDLQITNPAEKNQVYLSLDEVRLRLRLTQLLIGRLWLDFDVYAYEGGIAGSFCKRRQIFDLAVNFAGLRLAKYSTRDVVRKMGSLDLDGIITGQLEMHLNQAQKRDNNGFLNMNLDKMQASNIKFLTSEIPNMTFEPGQIQLRLQNQNFQVQTFYLKGNHLELDLSGRIATNNDLKRSNLFLNLRFKPSDELEESLGMLMYAMNEADDEGFYKLSINGTPGSIKTRR